MGIAPRRQRRLGAKVLVTYVVPADKTAHAIHHHHFAMVAEVDLETTDPAATGGKRISLHATCAQGLGINFWQGMAADAVIEHMHRNPLSGFFKE